MHGLRPKIVAFLVVILLLFGFFVLDSNYNSGLVSSLMTRTSAFQLLARNDTPKAGNTLVATNQGSSIAQRYRDLKEQTLKVQNPQSESPSSSNTIKRMLVMTRATRDKDPKRHDQTLNQTINSNCPFRCDYTMDRKLLPQSDGVFLQPSEIQKNQPKRYSSNQTIFLLFREAPGQAYMQNFKWLPPFQINYTIGWFPGADIQSGYDELVPKEMGYFGRPNRSEHQTNEEAEWEKVKSTVMSKTKPAFALISHCNTNSKREVYLSALQKRHPKLVDLFGKCYKECNKENCEVNKTRDYHFYFAFENAVCDGYVTEKFYRFKKLIVPIVLRKSDYVNLVPEGSFIAVDQFDSMDALTEHLEFLMNNKDEYLKYFEWTRHYERQSPNPIYRALCRACGKLYEPERVSAYKNMADFYSPKRLCDFDFVPRLIKRQTNS
ncbi:Glyco-tran-10-N domain-containing protein [Aphelenchoides besseyi]|nr:Glyco-tran-10-N domain-containing protein [Aphelenchoides besseyi]